MKKGGFIMKMSTVGLMLWLCAVGAHSAAFQNLDFESATLVPIPSDPYDRIYFTPAFPGWTGYVGSSQDPAVLTNSTFLCCSAVSLWRATDRIPPGPLDGNFALALQGSRQLDDPQPADTAIATAIAQTGLVPSGAQSLLFRAQLYGGPFEVALGGQVLSLVPVSTGSNYTMFGADISPWAGQESELRFTAIADNDPRTDSFVFLDSIQFSTTPVPEPSTFALFAVAAALGWFYCRRQRG
jgi:hypothetical protein